MKHEELEDSVPLYAAGALDRTERQALEAHLLSGCASCHSMLKEYQSVAALLPLALNQTHPPKSLKSKIMAERSPETIPAKVIPIDPTKSSLDPGDWMDHLFPAEAPVQSPALPWALGLGALLIVAIGGYFAWSLWTQHSSDTAKIQQLEASLQEKTTELAGVDREIRDQTKSLTELRNELEQRTIEASDAKEKLAQREAELEETHTQLNQRASARAVVSPQDELAALLRAPNVKAVSLLGSDAAKQAGGLLLYDSRTQKIWLYSVNLPECPVGMTYQLWSIHDKPVSIGTFRVEKGETTHLLFKKVLNFTNAKTFAVSLEPSGDRPQPTEPMYLLSRS
jgi:anti-sigma-K factor RskA